MAVIKYQFPGDNPAISTFGIHIPDDSQLGTGTFTTELHSGAFASPEAFESRIVNPHVFGISASYDPESGGILVVQIVQTDGKKPRDKGAFRIPDDLDLAVKHTLLVEFVSWRILSATIDGAPLATLERMKGH